MIHAIFDDLREMILKEFPKLYITKELPKLSITMGELVEIDADAIVVEGEFIHGDATDRIYLVEVNGKLLVRGEDPQHRCESETIMEFNLADKTVFSDVVNYVCKWAVSCDECII